EILQPRQKIGLEYLFAAVERVTGQPDHLLLGEANRTRMVELFAQFALVNLLGQPRLLFAVDEGECGVDVGVEAPNHLQHQKFVEVGIEQTPTDRIQLPGMVVDASCDIRLGHWPVCLTNAEWKTSHGPERHSSASRGRNNP